MKYLLAYDIGTTGVKTCLFEVDSSIRLVQSAGRSYPLYILENGGAEQHADDWWNAMCESTAEVLKSTGLSPEQIEGISFCSQMQGLVIVDEKGEPIVQPTE